MRITSGNRRDFILGAGALGLMAPPGGCRLFGGGPDSVRGAVLHVKDLTPESDWPRRAAEAGLNTIATHVFPEDVIPFLKSENGRRFTDECRRYGLAVEHEMHAIEYLLPRDLFDKNPDLFRLDEKGVRQRKSNGCFINPRTLEIVAKRQVEEGKVVDLINETLYRIYVKIPPEWRPVMLVGVNFRTAKRNIDEPIFATL